MKGNLAVVQQDQRPQLDEENVVKLAPHSIHLEQAVLGALLVAYDGLARVMSILQPDHFYRGAHQQIYQVMLDQHEIGREIDLISVADGLDIQDSLDRVGGKAYLVELAQSVPTTAHLEQHAHGVREYWARRRTMRLARQMAEAAANTDDVQGLLDSNLSLFADFATSALARDPDDMPTALNDWYDYTELRYEHKGQLLGVSSGYKVVDKLTTGFSAGDMIVIGARPSIGKTLVGMNIAWRVAVNGLSPKRVAFFSVEMGRKKLLDRLFSLHTGIEIQKLKTGDLEQEHFDQLAEALGVISAAPLDIIDRDIEKVSQIEAQIRRMVAQDKAPELVIIDYLQLLSPEKERDNQQEVVGDIAKALKRMARQLKIPVIVLAQVNRACETRSDKRPLLSDLRESGVIEAAADMVVMLYRDQVYNEDTPRRDCMELIFRKNRDGETGTVCLSYLAGTSTLTDWPSGMPVPACDPVKESSPRYSKRKRPDGGTYETKED